VVVAIIDSGIDDRRMPLLRTRDLGHYAFDGRTDDRSLPDPVGHGTAVASIAVGSGDFGVQGVAPEARFVSIAVTSTGIGSSASSLAPAIRLAVKHGAQVINLSLGSFAPDSDTSAAIEEAARLNVVVVAAAGDTASSQPLFPATLDNVIAVQALDNHGRIGPRANPVGSNGVGAPGSTIPAVVDTSYAGLDSGSSMAAAVVSGAVAVLISCVRSSGRVATEASLLRALIDSAHSRTFFQLRTAMRLLACAP
jgi:thermitase